MASAVAAAVAIGVVVVVADGVRTVRELRTEGLRTEGLDAHGHTRIAISAVNRLGAAVWAGRLHMLLSLRRLLWGVALLLLLLRPGPCSEDGEAVVSAAVVVAVLVRKRSRGVRVSRGVSVSGARGGQPAEPRPGAIDAVLIAPGRSSSNSSVRWRRGAVCGRGEEEARLR